MSDLLAGLLGAPGNYAWHNNTFGGVCPTCGHPYGLQQGSLQAIAAFQQANALTNWLPTCAAPPAPEPGVHWTRTGGKSWRVVIVR